jgi:adenylylsulfate kinase-like enzyme
VRKSTIAQSIERDLFHRGMNTYVLGDNIRHGELQSRFSPDDRVENIRRVSGSRNMADAGGW